MIEPAPLPVAPTVTSRFMASASVLTFDVCQVTVTLFDW